VRDQEVVEGGGAAEATMRRAEVLARGAHELLNPLANVVGFAHVLNRLTSTRPGEWSQESRTSIAMLVGEAERLKMVTEAFLELLRLQDGFFELAPSDVEVDSLVHEEVRALSRRSPGLKVTEEYSDVAAVVRTDDVRLRFVIRALLDSVARSGSGAAGRVAVLPVALGGARVVVHVPVVEAQTAALIVGGALDGLAPDEDSGLDLDLASTVTRMVARRLGLSIALVRQAGQRGADMVIAIPAVAPSR
jgi:signal transduction histidine kinase